MAKPPATRPTVSFSNLRSPRPINIVINIPVGDLVSYSPADFATLEKAIGRLERALAPTPTESVT